MNTTYNQQDLDQMVAQVKRIATAVLGHEVGNQFARLLVLRYHGHYDPADNIVIAAQILGAAAVEFGKALLLASWDTDDPSAAEKRADHLVNEIHERHTDEHHPDNNLTWLLDTPEDTADDDEHWESSDIDWDRYWT